MRGVLYRLILRMDGVAAVESGVRLRFASNIRLGARSYVDEHVYIHACPGGVSIGAGTLATWIIIAFFITFIALLLMHERFGRQTPRYWQAFMKQWEFIKNHQLDAVSGGWRSEVKPNGAPIPGRAKKQTRA